VTVAIAAQDKCGCRTLGWDNLKLVLYRVPIQGTENSTVVTKGTGNVLDYTWNFNRANLEGRSVLSSNGETATYTLTGTDKEG
jgi:hypothetical protein